MTESALYEGWVRHRRRLPVAHEFRYELYQSYIDLSELEDVLSLWPVASARFPAFSWFRRRDHFGALSEGLDHSVRRLVEDATGSRPSGPIRLLTHLRTWGFVFNPVSFFYCFDDAGRQVQTVVAEVDNTPWAERHLYVLPRSGSQRDGVLDFSFDKAFHVSPFMPMNQRYRWQFSEPGQEVTVHMRSFEGPELRFDATFQARRRDLTRRALLGLSARYPAVTLKVALAIYLNALRLWLGGARFFSHPGSAPREKRAFTTSTIAPDPARFQALS